MRSPADAISAGPPAPDLLPNALCPDLLTLASLFTAQAVAPQLWQEGGVSRDTEGGSAAKWPEMGFKSQSRQAVLIPRAEALFQKEEAAALLGVKQLGRKTSWIPARACASPHTPVLMVT